MSREELKQLDELLKISREKESPITQWEHAFLVGVYKRNRTIGMTMNQARVFDRLVNKHLKGEA